MKVEVNEKGKAKEKDFPKLMIGPNGSVVLMTCKGSGIRLTKGNIKSDIEVFDVCNYWTINNFTDFEGSITISND